MRRKAAGLSGACRSNNGLGGGGDGATAEQAGDQAEQSAERGAAWVAQAARLPARGELGGEQRAVAQLMRGELVDLRKQIGRGPARQSPLRTIEADRAILAGMIDSQHEVAQCLTGPRRATSGV